MSGSGRPGRPVAHGSSRVRLGLFDLMRPADGARDPVDRLRATVLRDLAAVLNARRRRRPPPAGLCEVVVSPVGYGIPDITAGGYAMEERRRALAHDVEATIRRFEPRLTDVVVTLREPRNEVDRVLRLRVEATLIADNLREQVSFETVVEPAYHDVRVAEG